MERVSPEIVPQRKLSNGMVIPGIGMGTFGNDRYTSEEVSDAVYGAIEAGYRLFDCAAWFLYAFLRSAGSFMADFGIM